MSLMLPSYMKAIEWVSESWELFGEVRDLFDRHSIDDDPIGLTKEMKTRIDKIYDMREALNTAGYRDDIQPCIGKAYTLAWGLYDSMRKKALNELAKREGI